MKSLYGLNIDYKYNDKELIGANYPLKETLKSYLKKREILGGDKDGKILYLKKLEYIIQCKTIITKIFIVISFTLLSIFFLIFCYKKISFNTIVNNNISSVKNYIKIINNTSKIDNNIFFLDDNYFPAFPRDGFNNFYNINKFNNFNLLNNHKKLISYVIVANYSFKYLPIIKENKNKCIFSYFNNFHQINISNNTTLFWKVY